MENSILQSIKKLLGIAAEYNHFDTDIMIHINSVLMALNQLGVGPADGFKITGDSELWNDFVTEEEFEAVKTYIYLKVKMLFDPPLGSAVMTAMNNQINELSELCEFLFNLVNGDNLKSFSILFPPKFRLYP